MLLAAALAASPWSAVPAPGGWGATSAEWHLTIRDGEPVVVRAAYTLASPDVRGGLLDLVGPELLVTNVSGPVFASPRGLTRVLEPGPTVVRQHFEGLYAPPSAGALSLRVLPAARARVTLDAPGLDVTIDGAVDGWLQPTETLSLTWRPHRAGEVLRESTVVQGEAATTFRGDAGAFAVDAVLRWRVVRGESARFVFSAKGLDELDVTGANIAGWERSGDTVTVRARAPVRGLFTVTIRGRAPLGKGQQAAPTPEPLGVLRVDRWVTMARSDEGELIPVAMPESVSLARLPPWARNLSDAPPLAAWHGPQPVEVLAASWEALRGPDTVVTAARYTLAAAREGRAALRMNLRVRNERRQYLRFRPPPGWTPIVVRVGNQPVSWLSDGDGGIYVPLEKSIETVKGLLSFPVDVEWIGEGAAWEPRGEQELRLPSVDAPVQAAAWEVHLPRGFRALQHGEALADESARLEAERRNDEVLSSALQRASSAYKQNDFTGAQRWLDEANKADASSEEVELLQGNLDVLAGKSSGNDAVSRRVKDLAKAKTGELSERQREIEEDAEDLYRAGDLDAAEQRYAAALDIAEKLQKTEQAESVAQKERIVEAHSRLAEIRVSRGNRVTTESPEPKPADVTVTPKAEEKGTAREALKELAAERRKPGVLQLADPHDDLFGDAEEPPPKKKEKPPARPNPARPPAAPAPPAEGRPAMQPDSDADAILDVDDQQPEGLEGEPPAEAPRRRGALVASPAPMALAMPLDGPAITTTQALLPAGTSPTWRFRYREVRGR